ncbi:MAG: 2-amino-4-hydroxy-6-hydroxymethyldihydropteridine diphosphokinase [Alphaproteobacteria bacterium]|nr:2-amino-4-hydroxy-6-hydroxymethyldihydropteridine diphosphokinase [Alphaproteobacteria bacterium]
MTKQHKVYLSLGSNLGDRLRFLRDAVARLEPYMDIGERSCVYKTAPLYVTDQPEFFNAAVSGVTDLDPLVLLYTIKEIERQVGRRPTYKYGPRVVDIDIIFYDRICMDLPELTIPHMRMRERAFVLRPLSDIAKEYEDPITGKTIEELLKELPENNDCLSLEMIL